MSEWIDVGSVEELKRETAETGVTQVRPGRYRLALSYKDGKFGAINGVCNHVGGPLGKGTLEGDYITCPWHYWKFHFQTGVGEPGFEADRVPMHEVKVENGRVLVSAEPTTKRAKAPHPRDSLTRKLERDPGPIRVVGISTTVMTPGHPRYSTSDALLTESLEAARETGAETKLLRLDDLRFKNCEGYFSKSFRACTWPCSITQADQKDEMRAVYEALIYWSDVALIATPIRWGSPSSLYVKMVERMNCIHDTSLHGELLIRNKIAGFIITGGQDGIQTVAGQLLCFWSEIGYLFPTFPFIAHSRGWTAEDMENNMRYVQQCKELKEGARDLAHRAVEYANIVLAHHKAKRKLVTRGGRKGYDASERAKEDAPA
jgi:multimeric flavodoxin WrbA/nitrite reductase/ring-hydroxylating ferredoxin subunit